MFFVVLSVSSLAWICACNIISMDFVCIFISMDFVSASSAWILHLYKMSHCQHSFCTSSAWIFTSIIFSMGLVSVPGWLGVKKANCSLTVCHHYWQWILHLYRHHPSKRKAHLLSPQTFVRTRKWNTCNIWWFYSIILQTHRLKVFKQASQSHLFCTLITSMFILKKLSHFCQ